MKAIVKRTAEPGIEVIDMQKPVVGESDFLVRVLAGSLCGSDVHIYEWTAGYEWVPMPVVLGHEFSGEVVEVGSRVSGLAAGDRITALPAMSCGECAFCRMGKAESCRQRGILGLTRNGAFAEYMLIKGTAEVLKIPDNVSSEEASLCEPLAITLNGIDLSGIKPGQTAAVFGPGPIGLLTVQLLKTAGAGTIVVTGTSVDKRRLEIARQMGADVIIDVDQGDPVEQVLQTVGKLDYVFEATGIPQTISQGLQMLKRGGRVMLLGIHAGHASFDPIDLVRQSKSLIGVYGYDRNTWLRVLRLLSTGKININPVITHRLPFSRGVEGFELAVSKTAAKVVFGPEP
ncbi:alcohol dehydrogenase catalytic domain-containing protein [bacterium]|nr:alcohol dehydrogenase catalytic domain-containing protein [bacterium]